MINHLKCCASLIVPTIMAGAPLAHAHHSFAVFFYTDSQLREVTWRAETNSPLGPGSLDSSGSRPIRPSLVATLPS
jgi:hypothetical protein